MEKAMYIRKNIQKNKKIIFCFLYFVIFFVISIALFWKAGRGYTYYDESYYYALAYRFILGDRFVADEWMPHQTSVLPILPFYYLYLLLHNGSNDGVVLFTRYAYTIVKILISLFIFKVFKKNNILGSVFSSLTYLVFSYLGLMAFSYNTISMGGLLISLLILYYAKESSKKKILWIFAGISFCISVCGVPHVFLLYPIFFIVALVNNIRKSDQEKIFFSLTAFKYVSLGGVALLIRILSFVFSRTSFNDLRTFLPIIMFEEPGHPMKNIFEVIFSYFTYLVDGAPTNRFSIWPLSCLIIILLGLAYFDKIYEKAKFKNIIIVFSTLLCILINFFSFITDFKMHSYPAINYFCICPNVLSLFIRIYSNNEGVRDVFNCIWIPGIMYSFIFNMASVSEYFALSGASAVAMVGSIIIITEYLSNTVSRFAINKQFVNFILVTVLLCFTFGGICFFRLTDYDFWENDSRKLNYLADSGPLKGIYLNKERYEEYHMVISATKEMHTLDSDEPVEYLTSNTWLYLLGKQKYGVSSPVQAWGFNSRYVNKISDKYYSVYPERIPKMIYIDKDFFGIDRLNLDKISKSIAEKYHYSVEMHEEYCILKK